MTRPLAKNAVVLGIALVLASLGIYNIVLKATWTLMDDGVFWVEEPQGLVAERVAAGGPAARAGVREGDVLLGIDGESVRTPAAVRSHLAARRPGDGVGYALLRLEEQRALEVTLEPLSQGNVTLFYYLSLAGFFSLVVGTIVMLRRPPDRAALHFYAICLLFFLMYSMSYTGKLNLADWTLFWMDQLAILMLPVVFLHFCLAFPERRLPPSQAWLVPAAYMPALFLAGAAVASQILFVTTPGGQVLWEITAAIDRWKPLYFAALFAVSFAVLLDSYRRTRSLLARRQMKWLVWGTGAGVMPFFAFYAIPFTLGREPRLVMELAGYIPLALIPLSLAYAVVKHRLMDVELIFKRSLVYVLAMAAIVGISLLSLGLLGAIFGGQGEEPHAAIIAVLTTLVVVLLFSPVKGRIQDLIDRLLFRDGYNSRKALLHLSQELNTDLDLARTTEKLVEGVQNGLGVSAVAVFLPDAGDNFVMHRGVGLPDHAFTARLPSGGPLLRALASGNPVDAEQTPEAPLEAASLELTHYFPCRVKGEVIAVIGVGRKRGLDPLNSEEADLLQALAGQAATAFMNGRLYRRLEEKATELAKLTEYNVNILESIDSGILVLDLDGKVARWNRAMESLYGRSREEVLGRSLQEIFPRSFLDALQGSLVFGEQEEIAHIYKLHLMTAAERSVLVNVSVAPFQVVSGERWGTVLIVEDVTARAHLERQLQHSEKMASIGLLAAGVAHEVNTPLTGISSYTQMLRQQLRGDERRGELLGRIESQTFRAARIINSLLNFSRSGSTETEPTDINRALEDVLNLLEHQLHRARVKMRVELDPELPQIRGSENRIQQVFFNLVLNAKDAMPSGGWLTITTRSEEGSVIAEVGDTGHGIAPEDVKRIYDPFFTTKGIGRGTGLGLSVSYGIVQEHGGTILVDTQPGQGTRFRLTFPALPVAQAVER